MGKIQWLVSFCNTYFFIGDQNLSDSVDNIALQDMFKEFGNITSCKVAMYEDGKSKGFGFVQFESEDSATAAIEKLNGSTAGDKQLYALSIEFFLAVFFFSELCFKS